MLKADIRLDVQVPGEGVHAWRELPVTKTAKGGLENNQDVGGRDAR